MKSYLRIIGSVSLLWYAISGIVYCQEVEMQLYPFGEYSIGKSIIEVSSGHLVVAGYFDDRSAGSANMEIVLVKTNLDGDTLWTKQISTGTDYDDAEKLIELSDGSFFLVGRTSNNTIGKSDLLFIKLNSDGDTIKTWTYGGAEWDFSEDIIESKDGFLYASTRIQDTSGRYDLLLFKMELSGDTIWTKKYNLNGSINPVCITETLDGDLTIAGGLYRPEIGDRDLCVLKLNNEGEVIWSYTSGHSGEDFAHSSMITEDGGLIAVGYRFDPTFNHTIPYYCKLNSEGSLLWEKSIPEAVENSQFIGIIGYLPDTYLLLGAKMEETVDVYDAWLYQIDTEGTMLSSEIFEFPEYQYPISFLFDSEKQIQICGLFNLDPNVYAHMGVMRVPPLRINMVDSVSYACGTIIEPEVSYLGNNPLLYAWSPNEGIDSVNSLTPRVNQAGDQITYYLSVSDGIFSTIDSIFIEVEQPEYLVSFSVDQQELIASPFLATFENKTPSIELYNFMWIFGDGDSLFSNEQFVTHEYFYNGSYDVSLVVTDKLNPCSDTKTEDDYIVCSGGTWPTNIEESNNLDVKVYPNPTSSRLNIEFDNPEFEPYQLTIYDNVGRVMQMVRFVSTSKVELEVQQYQPGVYYFMLLNEVENQGSRGEFLID